MHAEPTQGKPREPIIDVDGDFLWVPVEGASDEAAAEAFARDYSPERPCYLVQGREWLVTRPINEDDENEIEFSEEYGCHTIADPSEPGVGYEYWVVRCYPDMEEMA